MANPNSKLQQEEFDIGSALQYITLLGDEVVKIYTKICNQKGKDGTDLTVREFIKNNLDHFSDSDRYEELVQPSDKSVTLEDDEVKGPDGKKMTIDKIVTDNNNDIMNISLKQYLIMATCTNIRFISAQDRADRKCLTKSDDITNENSQIDMKLSFESHMKNMKQNDKFASQFDKLHEFKKPTLGLTEVLNKIFPNKTPKELYDDHININPNDQENYNKWEAICINPFSRRIQVLVYDLVQQIAYNNLSSQSPPQIDPTKFIEAYTLFTEKRNDKLMKYMHQIVENNDIVLFQEYHINYNGAINNKTYVLEETIVSTKPKAKKGAASAIVLKDKETHLVKVPDNMIGSNSENDIVAAKYNLGEFNILLYSIHTPTTGEDSAKIIKACFDYFNGDDCSDCTHMIIGIDANTKTHETKTAVVNMVFDNKGYFSYFPYDNVGKVLEQIKQREQEVEITSGGERTFGLQSQFGKAGESIENYVDYIILAHKDNQPKIEASNQIDYKSDLLSNNNPADHTPRTVTLDIGENTLRVTSFNVAGPNDKMLEYKAKTKAEEERYEGFGKMSHEELELERERLERERQEKEASEFEGFGTQEPALVRGPANNAGTAGQPYTPKAVNSPVVTPDDGNFGPLFPTEGSVPTGPLSSYNNKLRPGDTMYQNKEYLPGSYLGKTDFPRLTVRGGSRRSRHRKAKSSRKRKSTTRKRKSLAKMTRANAGKTRRVGAKKPTKPKSKAKTKAKSKGKKTKRRQKVNIMDDNEMLN